MREVTVHRAGPAGAPTVVLLHGTPGTGSIVEVVPERLGVRLIGVSRPGYEGTTDAPPDFATVVADALAVVEADTFAVLGISGGGPFAAAIAAAAPRRVTALGIAAGFGELESEDPRDAALAAQAAAGDLDGAAEGYRADCAAGFGPLLALPDDALADAVCPPGADPAFRRWAVADTRAALGSYAGLVRDNLTFGLPWGIAVEEIKIPALLWYGGADDVVPAAHGRWYADRIPHARLTVRDGEGHGRTCFGHWAEMLEALVPGWSPG